MVVDSSIFDSVFDSLEEFMGFFETWGNDTQENRDAVLKTDKLRCWYCAYIEDREYLAKELSADKYRLWYCRHVADNPDVWCKIRESNHAYWYCQQIKPRPEVLKHITEEPWASLSTAGVAKDLVADPEVGQYVRRNHKNLARL